MIWQHGCHAYFWCQWLRKNILSQIILLPISIMVIKNPWCKGLPKTVPDMGSNSTYGIWYEQDGLCLPWLSSVTLYGGSKCRGSGLMVNGHRMQDGLVPATTLKIYIYIFCSYQIILDSHCFFPICFKVASLALGHYMLNYITVLHGFITEN